MSPRARSPNLSPRLVTVLHPLRSSGQAVLLAAAIAIGGCGQILDAGALSARKFDAAVADAAPDVGIADASMDGSIADAAPDVGIADASMDGSIADAASEVGIADATSDVQIRDATPDVRSLDAGDAAPEGGTIAFASGPDWRAYDFRTQPDDAGAYLGVAATVCITGAVPVNCPLGAIVYGHANGPAVGWTALQGGDAFWIWRPDVVLAAIADSVTAGFSQTFTLGANPKGAIRLGADDYAAVYVNNIYIGSVGSTSDTGAAYQAQLGSPTFDLTAALHAGSNTVTVIGQNGPASFAGTCPDAGCNYSENSVGVIFAGTLSW